MKTATNDQAAPPKFPAGEYVKMVDYSNTHKLEFVDGLESAPKLARKSIEGLDDSQLDTRYINWTIRQIIHHLADSHVNSYVRFKWALTEETPTIKAYDESLWSETSDAKTLPLDSSLTILEGIHSRWSQLVRLLDGDQMQRGFFHPELNRIVTLHEALPLYDWHSRHHLSQIAWLREQNGW